LIGVVYALVAIVGTLLAFVGWLVHRALSAADQEGDSRVAVTQLEADVERMAFELEGTRQTLAAERKRADVLEQIIADEVNAPTGAVLAASDVRSRLLQQAKRWREAAAPAAPAPEVVPSDRSTERATAPELPVTRPSDV
jgi:hypothetical protein